MTVVISSTVPSRAQNAEKKKVRINAGIAAIFLLALNTAGWPPKIHTRKIAADEVTRAILPYVKGQYGN